MAVALFEIVLFMIAQKCLETGRTQRNLAHSWDGFANSSLTKSGRDRSCAHSIASAAASGVNSAAISTDTCLSFLSLYPGFRVEMVGSNLN